MKIFFLSDTHFGIHNSKYEKYLEMSKDYVYNFLIPTIKSNLEEGDILEILGDIFDNRTSINVKVLNTVISIFEDLAKILPIHIIIGNHDNWAMKDSSINSIATIRNIPNVTVYEKPKVVTWDGRKILMLSWIDEKDKELKYINKFKEANGDYIFTHSDLNGARTQLNPTRPIDRQILNVSDYEGIKRVYSGHIHINQRIKNFLFVGTPYHLDRNDVDNKKGIYILNLKTDEETFIENNYSPEFKKITILEEKDIELYDFEKITSNDYVDININNELLLNPKFRIKIDNIINKYNFNDIVYAETKTIIESKMSEEDGTLEYVDSLNFNIKDISYNHVKITRYSEDEDVNNDIKKNISSVLDEIFTLFESTHGKIV